MQQSLLFLLCEKLNKADWQLVLDFAASPAHNSRKEVALLLTYFKHYLGKTKENHFDKEKIWAQLYERPFEATTLRVLMHLATQLVQDALAYQHWKSKQHQTDLDLLAALRERKMPEKIIASQLKNLRQKTDNQVFKNQEFYYQQFHYASERYENAIAQKRNNAEGFEELSAALNVYFIAQKLRQACAELSHRTFLNQAQKIDFLEEILTYIAQNEALRATPLVALFYHSYHALMDIEDHAHFQQLKSILFASSHLFSIAELREYYLHAINCCIKRINTAKTAYIAEVFEIYRKGLEINVLLEGEQLSRFTYNNIVMAGVRMQKYDWTEQFIHDYKPFLEEKYQESTFQHALATFYFKKKNYEQAMLLLHSAEFDDLMHNLDARRMLLCIYYDLGEFEALEAHLEAFKIHLYRQKGLDYHRENYLNLVHFTKKLINLDFSKPQKIKELREEIETTTKLLEKEWLLAQL